MIIAGTEAGTVVVDLDWRGIVRRTGPRFIAQGPTALRGQREIVTSGRMAGDSTVVAGLDVETGVELWRMTAARGNAPVVVDGVELGAIMITANPSKPEVFLWRSRQDGVTGIAGYDYSARRVSVVVARDDLAIDAERHLLPRLRNSTDYIALVSDRHLVLLSERTVLESFRDGLEAFLRLKQLEPWAIGNVQR